MENIDWVGGRRLTGRENEDRRVPPHYYSPSYLFGGFGGGAAPPRRRAPLYSQPPANGGDAGQIPGEVDRRVFAADWPAALEIQRYQRTTAPAVNRAVNAEDVPPPRPESPQPPPPPSPPPPAKDETPAPPPAKRFKIPPPIWQKI